MRGTALALTSPLIAACLLSGCIFGDVKRGGGYHRRPPPGHHGDGHWRGAGEAAASVIGAQGQLARAWRVGGLVPDLDGGIGPRLGRRHRAIEADTQASRDLGRLAGPGAPSLPVV